MRAAVAVSVRIGFSKNRGRIPGAAAAEPVPPSGNVVPDSPVFQTYTAGTSGQAVLGWLLPSGTLTGQYIYYGTNALNCNPVGYAAAQCFRSSFLGASATSTTLTGITAGLTYFRLTASNANGESEESAQVSVTVT